MRMNKEAIFHYIQTTLSMKAIWMKSKLRNLHVALLIKRGKLLNIATNCLGSRAKGAGYEDRTIHAERAVLKKLGDHTKLDGAILIVVRISKGTHQVVDSTPCHACKCHLQKCVDQYGLRRIYYST